LKKNMIDEGSLVVIHDVGAYIISMWSRHCNRRRPSVLGVHKDGTVVVLFQRETKEDIIRHW